VLRDESGLFFVGDFSEMLLKIFSVDLPAVLNILIITEYLPTNEGVSLLPSLLYFGHPPCLFPSNLNHRMSYSTGQKDALISSSLCDRILPYSFSIF
jgi:hypothetical protein